jgi:hypothetical protein
MTKIGTKIWSGAGQGQEHPDFAYLLQFQLSLKLTDCVVELITDKQANNQPKLNQLPWRF